MSGFAEAPFEILGSIVRLLPLRQKLLCGCVCQNWLQLLRGSHTTTLPQLASAVWGNELRIIACGPQRVRDKIRISAVEATATRSARTEITLSAADTSQTATERQFVRWFARVAPHIGKVAVFLQAGETPPEHLGGTVRRGGWLFPQILTTLHLGQRRGHAPELHLSTGKLCRRSHDNAASYTSDVLFDSRLCRTLRMMYGLPGHMTNTLCRRPCSHYRVYKICSCNFLYFFDADIERFTHFPVCLKILAGLLTEWTMTDLVTDAQLQMWAQVKQLTSLTRMTINDPYGVFDDNEYYDMVELRVLSKMHSMVLNDYCNFATRAPNYTRLQRLELHSGSDDVVDLSCCTSLTALHLGERQDVLRKMMLPEGEDVRLEDLLIECLIAREKGPFDMLNLDMALQLTCLTLRNACPETLQQGAWPKALPALKSLTLTCVTHTLSPKLCSYTQLEDLGLSFIHVDTLPEWFSNLTQINTLRLQGCQFSQFPTSLLGLSQLKTLNMRYMYPVLLPESISAFVHWPHLSVLDLSTHSDKLHDLDSHLILLLLDHAFKQRGVRSPLLVDSIYSM